MRLEGEQLEVWTRGAAQASPWNLSAPFNPTFRIGGTGISISRGSTFDYASIFSNSDLRVTLDPDTGTLATGNADSTNPGATTGITNQLRAKNLVKAWAKIELNSGADPTLDDGFNVSSVTSTTAYVEVNIADNMNDTEYIVLQSLDTAASGTGFTNAMTTYTYNRTTGAFRIVYKDNTGVVDPRSVATAGTHLFVAVLGVQV